MVKCGQKSANELQQREGLSCHAVTAAGEAGKDELPRVFRQRARHQGGGRGGGGAGPGLAHSQGHHTLPLQGLQSGQAKRQPKIWTILCVTL